MCPSLQLLPECDLVGVMEGGRLTYFGPYDENALGEVSGVLV
jgi:hypothetical protein